MNKYVLIVIWFLFLMFAQAHYKKKYLVDSDMTSIAYPCNSWTYAIIVVVPLILMAAGRGPVADTGAYLKTYEGLPNNLNGLYHYISEDQKDKGFYVLSSILKMFFGSNTYLYLLVLAAFQALSLVWLYKKHSLHYVLSLYFFIASSDYLSWMFNGLRQFMAVTIMLFATPFILEKKYIKSIILILIASTMHQSALLMIPVIFIVQGEVWNKKSMLVLLGAVIAVASIDQFTGFLDSALSDTQYENVVSDYQEWEDDGTNPLRVAFYAIPTVISFLKREQIKEANEPIINLATNMSIMSTSLYIVSVFTSGIFIGRLPIYFSLFNYILLPWEIEKLLKPEYKKLAYHGIIIIYLCFYYYQMHFAWGSI